MNTELFAFWLGGLVACTGMYVLEYERFRDVGHRHLDQLAAYPAIIIPLTLLVLVFWPASLTSFYFALRAKRLHEREDASWPPPEA